MGGAFGVDIQIWWVFHVDVQRYRYVLYANNIKYGYDICIRNALCEMAATFPNKRQKQLYVDDIDRNLEIFLRNPKEIFHL